MVWKNVKLQVAMMKNKGGKVKKDPFFWSPTKPECHIPAKKDQLDHGRPVVMIENDDPAKTVVLALYQNKIVVRRKGLPDAVLDL